MTTPDTPALADRLKAISADAHRHAETRTLQKQMVQGRIPVDRLVEYLGQLHAVHAALERAIDRLPAADATAIGFADDLRHSRRLRDDLAVAGVDASDVEPTPACRELVAWLDDRGAADADALLGVLYVLEGSMNGNRFIVRALAPSLGADPGVGLSYLDPYGEEQRPRWAAFRAGLDHFGAGRDDTGDVEAACLRTFEAIAVIADEVIEPAAVGA